MGIFITTAEEAEMNIAALRAEGATGSDEFSDAGERMVTFARENNTGVSKRNLKKLPQEKRMEYAEMNRQYELNKLNVQYRQWETVLHSVRTNNAEKARLTEYKAKVKAERAAERASREF